MITGSAVMTTRLSSEVMNSAIELIANVAMASRRAAACSWSIGFLLSAAPCAASVVGW